MNILNVVIFMLIKKEFTITSFYKFHLVRVSGINLLNQQLLFSELSGGNFPI